MEIILSENAKFTLQHIFDVIDAKWVERVADEFLFEVEKILELVCKSPQMFKSDGKGKTRKGKISKQTSFIYEVNQTNLTVLYFWDNRQEPID